MKGDFSRDTYRPAGLYSRVMMQQGRVQIDADWNEQTSILLGYMRMLTRDLFGDAAGPAIECGFRIVTSVIDQTSLSTTEKDMLKAIGVDDISPLNPNDMLIMPGRYYVGGIPIETSRVMRYEKQLGASLEDAFPTSLKAQSWVAYLDVWEDYVSADQDSHIREIALGGADTCGRARVNWRVRVSLKSKVDTFKALERTKPGQIKVSAKPASADDMLCSIDPEARYHGAENQLYRIEIQTGSTKENAPTFKWSRDNGSVTFPVTKSAGTTVTLAHLGRDETNGLVVGDWVELIDDNCMAAVGVGQMAQVSSIDPHDLVVTLKLPANVKPLRDYDKRDAKELHALLRRWDHKNRAVEKGDGALAVTRSSEVELEDGIFATFGEGDFRAGDYWYIPARVLDGNVEWEGGFRTPDGPHHFYALLAEGTTTSTTSKVADLRCQIKTLPCE